MPVNYSPHGGSHEVALVHCPAICGARLVHLSQDAPDSWVLRDYIAGKQLRCATSPNPSSSTHTLLQIENEVVWSEGPPFYAWPNVADWTTYLRLRTMAVLGSTPSTSPPSAAFGNWQPL